jgi:hypothetical protein
MSLLHCAIPGGIAALYNENASSRDKEQCLVNTTTYMCQSGLVMKVELWSLAFVKRIVLVLLRLAAV